jgi:tetratricopeptide (TPR) repeat protein
MGGLLVGQGDCSGAMPLLERARCLLPEEVDTPGLSYVEFHLGLAKIAQGDVEAGLLALSTAQRIQQACGDIRHLSATLSAKAVVDIRRGRFANAQALLRQALDIQERLEEHEARVHTLRLLGYCLSGQGLGDAAKRCCTQADQLSMLLSLPTPDASAPGGNGRGLIQ